jgi:hypothetical protein
MNGITTFQAQCLLKERHNVLKSLVDSGGVSPHCVYAIRSYYYLNNEFIPADLLKVGSAASLYNRMRTYEQQGTVSKCEWALWMPKVYKTMVEDRLHDELKAFKHSNWQSVATETFLLDTNASILKANMLTSIVADWPEVMSMDIFDHENVLSYNFRDEKHTQTQQEGMFWDLFDEVVPWNI